MARYLIAGGIIVNDMEYPDGRKVTGFLGGALYTVNGVLPYTEDLLFLSEAGPDFDDFYGDYFRLNHISPNGIANVFPKTCYTLVKYEESGEWSESSIYGPEHHAKYGFPVVRAKYILENGGPDVRGIYVEASATEPMWDQLDEIRERCPNAKIMVELVTEDAHDLSIRDSVMDLLNNKVDIYSLNLPESMALFGTSSEDESIQAIIRLGKPCFFRVGKKGSYMIQDGKAWFAPSVESDTSVDPTGCGNCSTGAAMYGFCEGCHPLLTAYLANVAAGVNARQYGPFPHYTEEIKKWMRETAEKLYERGLEK
ncbi:MAG: hypothetical protein IJ091_05835 [Oscillospiraceae bacterium]|nr:hypothetical protein [Oscillospiraceae bacterium]